MTRSDEAWTYGAVREVVSMGDVVTSEEVVTLARLAGFDFDAAWCALLAPQLAWLLNEAARLRAPGLAGEEPVLSFRPAAFWDAGGTYEHG